MVNKPPARRRVLIVDDEEAILVLLQMAFEGVDWHIEVSTSANVALERHRSDPFDLIITDKNLPDMDGVSLIREIRRYDNTTRIVIMTGYRSLGSAIETANLGIDAYVEKPFEDVYDLLDIAKRALARLEPLVAARVRVDTESDAPRSTATAPAPENAAPRAAHPAPEIRKNTVLVASAHKETRNKVGEVFHSQDLKVVSSQTSAEMFQVLREWTPVLLLIHGAMDIAEIVLRVRKSAPRLPIAILCDSLDVDTTKQLIGMQVGAIITGSMDEQKFNSRIKKLGRSVKTLVP